jgi:hypothetical protein
MTTPENPANNPVNNLPPDVINTAEVSVPNIPINLPLKDENTPADSYIPNIVLPEFLSNLSLDYLYSLLSSLLSDPLSNVSTDFTGSPFINNIDMFLKILIGVLIILYSAQDIPTTFYGYFLILFIGLVILRMTKKID